MRKLILVTLISTSVLISSCSDSENDEEVSVQEASLSQLEIDDLNFLREEEKLARDVYLYSFNLYSLQIFKNVSDSEQKHMDSVLELLNKYNLQDPASENMGEFNNSELQILYNDLTQKSSISVVEALEVGNIIEDLDIKDLAVNEERTTNIDLLDVYGSLKCGSRNHLRNYNAQLIFNGGLYIPTYISIDEFEAIIATSNEQCNNN